MIPVYQTDFGCGRGNCLQACIASILELPLEDVPHFSLEEEWREARDNFLKQFDLYMIEVDAEACRKIGHHLYGYHIIAGPAPGQPYDGLWHAVVGYNGEIVHDPHPKSRGLEKEVQWDIFVSRMEER